MTAPALALDQPKHCRLGGSAASIYLSCTAAPSLWEGRQRFASAYADEGTTAHEVIEHLQHRRGALAKALATDGEMLVHASDFVAHCDALRPLHTSMVEEQVSLEWLWTRKAPPEPLYGTVDFGALTEDQRTLIILDFKYGKGVPVSPKDNPQLMFYALGVYFRLYQTVGPEVLHKILYVKMGIYAPRQGDTEPRWWTVDFVDLLDWGYDILKPAVEKIHAQTDTSFKTGTHCRFCIGAPICPALRAEAMQTARNAFPDDLTTKIDVVSSRLTPPSDLSDDELGEALTRGEILSTWLNAVRAETSARLARGRTVSGWKLVSKKGYRRWCDTSEAACFFSTLGLPQLEILTEPELRSPAQVEKVLKAHKLSPKLVDPLVEVPITGVSLVPTSHPAPAVLSAPGTNFPTITDLD
jgi:Protein of unknown function (DUF2800)